MSRTSNTPLAHSQVVIWRRDFYPECPKRLRISSRPQQMNDSGRGVQEQVLLDAWPGWKEDLLHHDHNLDVVGRAKGAPGEM